MSALEIAKILNEPNGARFYKCALQVNPNDYLRYRGVKVNPNAQAYAMKLIEEAKKHEIQVMAITHHNNADFVEVIQPLANAKGITIFPGFELKSSEGVHVLCIYDPTTTKEILGRYLGEFGIHDPTSTDDPCKFSFVEILGIVQEEQKGVVVAAHSTNSGGLFKVLKGQPCINAWKDERLLAIQIPGPIENLKADINHIVRNKNLDYERDIIRGTDQAIAVVNAKDVAKSEDLANASATTWIKMAELSVQGLRQAFLDPDSRIRLNSEEIPPPHAYLEAIEWEGGFLDGLRLHLNENLNVLIGGRGAGKSTAIESIRHALGMQPATEEAERNYRNIVKDVIGPNTTIRILVHSPKPSPRSYCIVRNGSNPPDVRDAVTGDVLSLDCEFIVGELEIYGQHELSELSRQETKQRRLLKRFASEAENAEKKKAELLRKLNKSTERIELLLAEMEQLDERLAEKPRIEETLKRYWELGVEEKLKAQRELIQEEHVFKVTQERISSFGEAIDILEDSIPNDTFLSDTALKDLAGKNNLHHLHTPIKTLTDGINKKIQELRILKEAALKEIAQIEKIWRKDREKPVLEQYSVILKGLDIEAVDGDEFIKLHKKLESLKPLKDRRTQMNKDMDEYQLERSRLLAEWEDTKMQDRREWEGVAKWVSKKLKGSVQVKMGLEDRSSLKNLLQQNVEGTYSQSLKNLLEVDALTVKALAMNIRSGKDALATAYPCLTTQAAEKLVNAGERLAMRIEQEDWLQMPYISLNLGTKEKPRFVPLKRLSTGQKATALLCLLLLESNAPLLIDQPEDDLDNRFISEYIVPKMKQEKRRRQFLFTSHNANITVLGDAELIVGMTPCSDEDNGALYGEVSPEHQGAIDNAPVRELVEEILEGGKEAFSLRRAKYGF